MRITINIIIGLLLIGGAIFFAKKIIASKKKPVVKTEKIIKKVTTERVKNGSVPVTISANGNLAAAQKIELFSEVQGIFKRSNKLFKAGENYRKGQVLLEMDGVEFYSTMLAQKSSFYNLIVAAMPDMKLDFPEAHPKWEKYLQELDINKSLPPLPETSSNQEKYYVSGKQIISTYYSIKNMEQHYSKFVIRAPFNGVLTEALVTKGTLIRSGQKLGEFISTRSYELEVKVSKDYYQVIQVGKKVRLNNLDKTNTWEGEIVRVNGKIDQSTQTIAVFIEVSSPDLKEGMYLEANLESQPIPDAIEVSRKLLVKGDNLFIVEDEKLVAKKVKTHFFTEKTAIVSGLENGTVLLKIPVTGAYEGMIVEE